MNPILFPRAQVFKIQKPERVLTCSLPASCYYISFPGKMNIEQPGSLNGTWVKVHWMMGDWGKIISSFQKYYKIYKTKYVSN